MEDEILLSEKREGGIREGDLPSPAVPYSQLVLYHQLVPISENVMLPLVYICS
jgi:hypothetical protein